MSEESIRTTAELIRHADAVLVGAGSGLSSAAGYNHYHRNAVFEANFHDFEEAYGIQSLFQGFYYIYSKPEQQWGFYSRYIKFMEDAPAGQPYIDLVEILKDKEYFILTTNCDIQIPKVFPEDRICQFQGDFRYFQCSQPCHDKLYESHDLVSAMLDNMEGLEVPAEWIPRCPECGWKMVPWVQDNTFLQGEAWQTAYQRYEDFVRDCTIQSSVLNSFFDNGTRVKGYSKYLILAAAQFLQVLVSGYHCLTGVLVGTVDADGIFFVQQGLAVCCRQLCSYL